MFKRDLDLEKRWGKLLMGIEDLLGKKPKDLNGVLFLIGVQELGKGYHNFSKEQKQDLMHIAICKVLSLAGFYELEYIDQDGVATLEIAQGIAAFRYFGTGKAAQNTGIGIFRTRIPD
jgi:hypothetical protein